MARRRINDDDRRQWVLNDEGLYLLQQESRRSVREFVCMNRALIDEVIGNVTTGARRQHYLVYG